MTFSLLYVLHVSQIFSLWEARGGGCQQVARVQLVFLQESHEEWPEGEPRQHRFIVSLKSKVHTVIWCLCIPKYYVRQLPYSIQERRHNQVKTWTRHMDLFNKDFIFVPINQSWVLLFSLFFFFFFYPQSLYYTTIRVRLDVDFLNSLLNIS